MKHRYDGKYDKKLARENAKEMIADMKANESNDNTCLICDGPLTEADELGICETCENSEVGSAEFQEESIYANNNTPKKYVALFT